MLHSFVNAECSALLSVSTVSSTRGHNFKLTKPLYKSNLELYQFTCRAISAWNGLPDGAVTATSIIIFKMHFKNVDFSRFCKYHS